MSSRVRAWGTLPASHCTPLNLRCGPQRLSSAPAREQRAATAPLAQSPPRVWHRTEHARLLRGLRPPGRHDAEMLRQWLREEATQLDEALRPDPAVCSSIYVAATQKLLTKAVHTLVQQLAETLPVHAELLAELWVRQAALAKQLQVRTRADTALALAPTLAQAERDAPSPRAGAGAAGGADSVGGSEAAAVLATAAALENERQQRMANEVKQRALAGRHSTVTAALTRSPRQAAHAQTTSLLYRLCAHARQFRVEHWRMVGLRGGHGARPSPPLTPPCLRAAQVRRLAIGLGAEVEESSDSDGDLPTARSAAASPRRREEAERRVWRAERWLDRSAARMGPLVAVAERARLAHAEQVEEAQQEAAECVRCCAPCQRAAAAPVSLCRLAPPHAQLQLAPARCRTGVCRGGRRPASARDGG